MIDWAADLLSPRWRSTSRLAPAGAALARMFRIALLAWLMTVPLSAVRASDRAATAGLDTLMRMAAAIPKQLLLNATSK